MLTFASHGGERVNKMGVVQVVELFTFSSMVATHPIEDLKGGLADQCSPQDHLT